MEYILKARSEYWTAVMVAEIVVPNTYSLETNLVPNCLSQSCLMGSVTGLFHYIYNLILLYEIFEL